MSAEGFSLGYIKAVTSIEIYNEKDGPVFMGEDVEGKLL